MRCSAVWCCRGVPRRLRCGAWGAGSKVLWVRCAGMVRLRCGAVVWCGDAVWWGGTGGIGGTCVTCGAVTAIRGTGDFGGVPVVLVVPEKLQSCKIS